MCKRTWIERVLTFFWTDWKNCCLLDSWGSSANFWSPSNLPVHTESGCSRGPFLLWWLKRNDRCWSENNGKKLVLVWTITSDYINEHICIISNEWDGDRSQGRPMSNEWLSMYLVSLHDGETPEGKNESFSENDWHESKASWDEVRNPDWNKDLWLRQLLLLLVSHHRVQRVQEEAQVGRIVVGDVEDLAVGRIADFQSM